MTENRTIQCKKRKNIFKLLSLFSWVGVTIFTIVSIFVKSSGGEEAVESSGITNYVEFKSGLIGLAITIILALICAVLVSHKMRTTLYMLSIIASAIMFGNIAIFIEFGIWFLDEYVFQALSEYYLKAYQMNKEIDLRETE